jgi:CubicO group peptidase (beta-lactamase class C family)
MINQRPSGPAAVIVSVALAGAVVACAAPVAPGPSGGQPPTASVPVVSPSSASSATPGASPTPAETSAQACTPSDSPDCWLDALEERASEGDFNGVILIAKDSKPIWHRPFGTDMFGDPMLPDFPMNIASSGKMFTAVAAAQLVEAGKLDFDDTLGELLPDDLPAAARRASIGQLLSHTSGIGMYSLTNEEISEPGEYRYSNIGFDLVARVVERVSGDPFAEILATNIFAPASMESTSLGPQNPGTPQGSGGERSTAGDLLRFANALLAHRLLGEAMTIEVMSPHVTIDKGGYGYGFVILKGQHGEPPSVGHFGGLASMGLVSAVEMNPTVGYTVIVLCRSGFADIEPALVDFQKAIGMSY